MQKMNGDEQGGKSCTEKSPKSLTFGRVAEPPRTQPAPSTFSESSGSGVSPADEPQRVRRIFPLALPSTARMSRQTQEVLRHVHRVRLPSKWSTIPTWEKLAQAEIERAIQEEGERAFEDLRLSIGDPEGRGPILRRRSLPGGGEIVQLTKESELRLKETWGLGQGFVQTDSL